MLANEFANWLALLLQLLFIVDYLGSLCLPVSLLLLIVVFNLLFSPVDICSNNWDVATEDEDLIPPPPTLPVLPPQPLPLRLTKSLWLGKSTGD